MRSLPPLNALRAFEVAARTGSYLKAGAELGVTHSAVSRQIALLESWLGQRLFVRVGRRMAPTPAALAFAAEVSSAFDKLGMATELCGRSTTRRIIRVDAPTTFAMRWLIPRLGIFQANHPEADVIVTTTSALREDLRGGFDVAVRREASAGLSMHDWGPYRAVKFLDEANTLVASPSLLANTPLRRLADIADHTLLSSETRSSEWSDWLDAAGLPRKYGRQRVFDHFHVTLQAIKDGPGIGIGPIPILTVDIVGGSLVAPFPEIRVARPGYVALVPNDVGKTLTLTAFVSWLQTEGANSAPMLKHDRFRR